MTTEELLVPRYKVMILYPLSTWLVGDIIHLYEIDPHDEENFYLQKTEQFGDWYWYEKYLKECPQVFHKMDWWEEIKPEYFPQYVKKGPNSLVRKIKEYHPRIQWMIFENGIKRKLKEGWLPATIEEFQLQEANKLNEKNV